MLEKPPIAEYIFLPFSRVEQKILYCLAGLPTSFSFDDVKGEYKKVFNENLVEHSFLINFRVLRCRRMVVEIGRRRYDKRKKVYSLSLEGMTISILMRRLIKVGRAMFMKSDISRRSLK
jgi:hypothetical protein